jgi:hypothetical protein
LRVRLECQTSRRTRVQPARALPWERKKPELPAERELLEKVERDKV